MQISLEGRVILTGLIGYNNGYGYYVFDLRRQGTVFWGPSSGT